jgi:hypothetical protein
MRAKLPKSEWSAEDTELALSDISYSDLPDDFRDAHSENAWRNRRYYVRRKGEFKIPTAEFNMLPVVTNKNEASVTWEDLVSYVTDGQALRQKAKRSNEFGSLTFDTDKPLSAIVLGDMHWMSWGTDHVAAVKMTEEIIELGLHVIFVGDLLQMAINVKHGIMALQDNALPPDLQMHFLELWLDALGPRILLSTWDNHAVQREEAATGFSRYADLFKRRCLYFNGIGHVDLTVGQETYSLAVSHKFRGNSYLNPLYGQMRYGRFEGQDRELIIAGDSHVPGILHYYDGPTKRCAVNCGTLQTSSGYAQRFYSLYSQPTMPIITFYPDKHLISTDWNVEEYVARLGITPG